MTRSAIRLAFVVSSLASVTALGCDGGCSKTSESPEQASAPPSSSAASAAASAVPRAEPPTTDAGAVVQNAPNGEYLLYQPANGASAVIGQFVSQDGAEYWWLYPAYKYPGLDAGKVSITYKLAKKSLSGFQAPTAASHAAPLGAAPAGTVFVLGKAASDTDAANEFVILDGKSPLSMQVDPMHAAGYIGIYDESHNLIGQVLAALQDVVGSKGAAGVDSGTQAPVVANEHWFMISGKSQYPSEEGQQVTVTFEPFPGEPKPSLDWWVPEKDLQHPEAPPKKAHFYPDKFEEKLKEKMPDVVVSCGYWKN